VSKETKEPGRKVRTHIVNDDNMPPLTPKHLTRQEFGNRLYKLMLRKGWTQSELARRADMPRDSVSTYIRGRTMPTPTNVQKLAAALGVAPEQILPNLIESAIEDDIPDFEFKASPHDPSRVWLRINRLVNMKTALQIATLLEGDNALDAERSSRAPTVFGGQGQTPTGEGPSTLPEA
jgi:transcriptional regulator with XRE-family HTH domain